MHQPSITNTVESVREELAADGIDAHRVEVPDAEEGKSLAVAGFCWEVLGKIGMDRCGIVVSFGGGREHS